MGTDRLTRAASAAEQLCRALWETLREQAEAGNAHEVGELSRRLVEVCESFGAIASAGVATPAADADAPAQFDLASRSDEGIVQLDLVDHAQREEHGEPGEEHQVPGEEHQVPDEEHQVPDDVGSDRRWPSGPVAALVDEYEDGAESIEVTDVRTSGHPPVNAAVQRRLERYALDGAPFSVLLIEVLDVERLRALRATGDLLREIWAVESAIAEQLRPADTLLREIDGRWWLIAPDTDPAGARQLAEKLAAAARRFAHRGAPLRVVVGIAVCPDHGLEAATLIGHADVDLYAAQAAGRSIGGFDDEPRLA